MKAQLKVNFNKKLREWDGFGINYVAAAQTRDYRKWPQDYGSFGLLSENDRQQIIDLIFGDDGLKPSIGKMFIDSLQAGIDTPENLNLDPNSFDSSMYDHHTTLKWMTYFMKEGVERTESRGEGFKLICSLYGPPAWTTKQKVVRGRDIDPVYKYEVAKYIIAFIKFMKQQEGLPIAYVSLHNEGGIEEIERWPKDGTDGPEYVNHDYNAIWSEEQVVDFIRFMPYMLNQHSLEDLKIGNGECTFLSGTTKYVKAIIEDPEALLNYGLMTSHGFVDGQDSFTSEPIDLIREKKANFHAWITSASWGDMDISFLTSIHKHIYISKVNGYIPWAAVQCHSQWVGGDPNPGTAILINDEGKWSIQRGYYLYKHYCPVGKSGMAVVETESNYDDIMVSAFSGNKTVHPDAMVLINNGLNAKEVILEIKGNKHVMYSCVVTDNNRTYEKIDDIIVENDQINICLAPESVMSLCGM